MFIVLALQWWYGPGWLQQWRKIISRTRSVGGAYSGKTLLRTLFSPWKRITALSAPNPTIQQRFQALIDNLVSRLVGAIVRFFTLLAALVSLIVTITLSTALAVLWPLIPVLSVAAIIKGLGLL
jgi:hypothetical protein